MRTVISDAGVPDIRVLATCEVPTALLEQIRHLLGEAFAGDFSEEDWQHTLGGWHVLISEGNALLAHAAVVERTLEVQGTTFAAGYVEGVATTAHRQGEGLGSSAMRELMRVLQREFQLGALSTDRHRFYERLGWERWRGPTFVRHGSVLLRTAAEDDGVMVLRFGASSSIDLDATIACRARPGGDW